MEMKHAEMRYEKKEEKAELKQMASTERASNWSPPPDFLYIRVRPVE